MINIYKQLLYIFPYICLFLTSRLVDLLCLNIRLNIRKIRQLILKTKLFSMNFDTKKCDTDTHFILFYCLQKHLCTGRPGVGLIRKHPSFRSVISSFVDKLKTVTSVSITLEFKCGSDLRVPAHEEEGRKQTSSSQFFQENKD